MIFAAGLGTRFKPWTDAHPKALAPVNGKSLLQRNIEYLQQFGIREVVVNVHHFPEQVLQAIERNRGWGSHIRISDEAGQLLETGGGLKKAEPLLSGDPIVLMNVDILTDLNLQAMINAHRRYGPLSTIAVTRRNSSRRFLFNHQHILCGWRNHSTGEEKICRPASSYYDMAFSGIHVISRQLPSLIRQSGKTGIVDVYLSLAADYDIRAFDHTGSNLIDVGKPDSIAEAEKTFF